MRLQSISLKNARSVRDSGLIDILPLTILLGQNSAGKSTFLRTIPLLKQSLSSSASSPISWFGVNVDFGSFDKFISRGSADNYVEFGFKFITSEKANSSLKYRLEFNETRLLGFGTSIDVSVRVVDDLQLNFISRLDMKFLDNVITAEFNGEQLSKITINGQIFEHPFPDYSFTQTIIPNLSGLASDIRYISFSGEHHSMNLDYFFGHVASLDKRMAASKIFQFHSRLKLSNIDSFNEQAKANLRYLPNSARKKLAELLNNQDGLAAFHNSFIMSHIGQLLSMLSISLSNSLRGSRYVGPTRDVGDRYYRATGGINELDARGQNVANYINQLSMVEKTSFDQWFIENLGYKFDISLEGSHYSLVMLDPKSGEKFSLSDVGFGFSQILPLLINLWDIVFKSDEKLSVSRNTIILSIEQPELHLHPKFQARLAEMIISSIKSARNNGLDVRLIVETHSDHFVNSLGISVSEGRISENDISLVLFENKTSTKTTVRRTSFSPKGRILNWPSGFMEPDI